MALTQPWLEVSTSLGSESPARTAEAIARSGSPWFDGHFPGQPILPGIAVIALAFEAARDKEAREGNRIRLKAVKRVRFKKPIRPDEPFTLTLKRDQKESGLSYAFMILLGDEAACTGILDVEPLADTM